jgi:hypothetical protein
MGSKKREIGGEEMLSERILTAVKWMKFENGEQAL